MIVKVGEFQAELKEQYPECMQSNPNRQNIFLITMTTLLLTQVPCERFFKAYYMTMLPHGRFPVGSELRSTKAKMLGERTFRLTNYSLFSYFLYQILSSDSCDFFDRLLGGDKADPKYFVNYPC